MKMKKNEQFPEGLKDYMIGEGKNSLLIETEERRSCFVDRNKTDDQL